MIELTKISGEKFLLNPGLIEMIEMVPDTLITMTNGKSHYVLEPARKVAADVDAYRVKIMARTCDVLNLCVDTRVRNDSRKRED